MFIYVIDFESSAVKGKKLLENGGEVKTDAVSMQRTPIELKADTVSMQRTSQIPEREYKYPLAWIDLEMTGKLLFHLFRVSIEFKMFVMSILDRMYQLPREVGHPFPSSILKGRLISFPSSFALLGGVSFVF